jgi:hypothetical protein
MQSVGDCCLAAVLPLAATAYRLRSVAAHHEVCWLHHTNTDDDQHGLIQHSCQTLAPVQTTMQTTVLH